MFPLGVKKCFENNKVYSGAGSDLTSGKIDSPEQCQAWCQRTSGCGLFTFVTGDCYLKEKGLNPQLVDAVGKVAGLKFCPDGKYSSDFYL